jgi:hypothetical protein
MLKQIVVAAACIAALMAAVKDGRVLRTAGMTASCTVVTLNSDGSQLAACRAGRLEGAPDLSRRGCTSAGTAGGTAYWRCPQAP